MIPRLDGTREIVDFQECPSILLYKNVEYEEYPKHWHTSTEIIMVVENDYQVICNGKLYSLDVGDILIIAPGVVHTIPEKKGTRYILLANFSNCIILKAFDSILSLIQPTIIVSEKNYPSIYRQCQDLILNSTAEYFGNEQFKEVAVYNQLINLLLLVGREYTKQSGIFTDAPVAKQQEYMQKFMTLCDYINNNCTESLSVDDAANMVGFSKFHFSRLFKKFTGTTFYSYVNERRIAHATLLLLDSEKSITEVAIGSGFNSISSFIRIFKINRGCTPTEFRNMHHVESETAKEAESS